MTGKAVATKKAPGAIEKFDYTKHAGKGLESQTVEDQMIPFLSLLQGLSPEVQPGPENVEGAKIGDLLNSVTKEIYGASVEFIPCFMERKVMEWVKRKHGGGLVTMHAENSELWAKAKEAAGTSFGQIDNPDNPKNDMVPTVYLRGLIVVGEKVFHPVVISFTSTKLKAWRTWNTARDLEACQYPADQKPPLYANRVRISVAMETNPKGTFANFVLAPFCGGVTDSLIGPGDAAFEAAARLYAKSVDGTAKVVEETQAGGGAKADGGGTF